MMRKVNINALALLLLLVVWGCSSTQKTQKPATTASSDKNDCLPLQFVTSYGVIDSDPFELESLVVENNCLSIVITYEGGCGTVDYTVYYNKKVSESYPPQQSLMLKLADNDPCREMINDTLRIDLSYFESMARAGGLKIGLEGANKQVLYALPLR
ncbi:MAG: hypothetical protein PF694_08790 [Bacteroidetes bacterium]|jgi:hypothetical protein|nr:hypothetical protein [Bacteroidota bacterium]